MQVVMARGIAAEINRSNEFIEQSLRRYFNRDWGDACKEDWKMNDSALKYRNDKYVIISYNDIFIITEHDHSVTTILFKEEY